MKAARVTIVFVCLMSCVQSYAQKQNRAWKLMDKVYAATVKDSGRYCEFTAVTEHTHLGTTTTCGFTVTRNSCYHWEEMDTDSGLAFNSHTHDGRYAWWYSRHANVLFYFRDTSERREFVFMNCYHFNEKNYSARLVHRSKRDKVAHIVSLKPLDPKSDYAEIVISIHRSTLRITRVVTHGSKGGTNKIGWKYLSIVKAIPDSVFTYDVKRYPGVQTVDQVNGE